MKKPKKKFDRNEVKKRGFFRFLLSWKYSLDGLIYAYKYEQSVLIHLIISIIVIIAGVIFKITSTEALFLFVSLGVLLSIELINTSIEATIDLITLEINPLAKIAKDCGSAATFIVTLITFVISMSIFLPKIFALF